MGLLKKKKALQAKEGDWGKPGSALHQKVWKTGASGVGDAFKSGDDFLVSSDMRLLNAKNGKYTMHGPKGKLLAKGGEVKGVHGGKYGISKARTHLANAQEAHSKEGWAKHMEKAKQEHEMVLEELKAMPKPKLLAHGGMAECGPECQSPCSEHEFDMVGHALEKRRQMLSQGGKVANKTEESADFMPNEFDYLALNDDLEFSYDGANSGDKLGNQGEDERRADAVMRAMMKRKKQHNPRPA